MMIDQEGCLTPFDSPSLYHLPVGAIWRVARPARIEFSETPSIRTLEDTPFYTRSQIQTRGAGGRCFMHESLDLNRFCQPWVQSLLRFRMPRREISQAAS